MHDDQPNSLDDDSNGVLPLSGLGAPQVPEPGSFALLIAGLIGLSVYAWRRSNKS